MSRYLRIPSGYLCGTQGASLRIKIEYSGQLETLEQTETWGFRYATVTGLLRSKHFECGISVTVDEQPHISFYYYY
jgi:hypothetical protein